MGLKDPTVLAAKPGSYLLFGPPARGNGSRLLAAVWAQSRNSIQAARGAGLVCSCQSSRWMCYLAANSLFPAGVKPQASLCRPCDRRFSETHRVLPLSGS